MKTVFGYVRVSTAKQGEHGVSLQEQRDAIQRHIDRNGLQVVEWFEELQTAAKRGRPVFNQMLTLLRQGKAGGVVIHKIDRSARNLKDWADLGELIDRGIDVHFANESLDLHSRGGRLSADIQAVVAADYIRNLREETRKGFYGRIKQGLYPLPCPLGYLDRGKGQPKEPDPAKAPLVHRAFALYATGKFTLVTLGEELHRLGLRNKRGGSLTRTGLSALLNNPFYIGLIRLKRTGETFPGVHEPLVSKSLFDRVRAILTGKTPVRTQTHDFFFRRLLSCQHCGYTLTGERQKGHTYYRCHTNGCPTKALREETITEVILRTLQLLELERWEREYLQKRVTEFKADWEHEQKGQVAAITLRLGRLQDRLGRVTDAFLDGVLDRRLFEDRKAALLLESKAVEEQLAELTNPSHSVPNRLGEFLELTGSAYFQYKQRLPDEGRELLKILTSNRLVHGKNVVVTLKEPFQMIADRSKDTYSPPYRARLRTLDTLLQKLWGWFKQNTPAASELLAKLCDQDSREETENKEATFAA